MNAPLINGPLAAAGNPPVYQAILAKLREAQAIGEMPARREEPSRDCILFWIGEPDDLVAYAVALQTARRLLWIELIWVAPEHRRKGLGKAMLTTVTDLAHRIGFDTVQLGTAPDNEPMQALGRMLGFSPRAIIMERKLS